MFHTVRLRSKLGWVLTSFLSLHPDGSLDKGMAVCEITPPDCRPTLGTARSPTHPSGLHCCKCPSPKTGRSLPGPESPTFTLATTPAQLPQLLQICFAPPISQTRRQWQNQKLRFVEAWQRYALIMLNYATAMGNFLHAILRVPATIATPAVTALTRLRR